MALVEVETDRIDLFCLRHFGSNSDETRRLFIKWNSQYFEENPTYWLEVGRDLWTHEPPLQSYGTLLVEPNRHLKVTPDGRLIV